MKKYILSVAALLLIAGMAGAQTTSTKTSADKPVAKTHKTTTAKKTVSNPTSSTTTTTDKGTSSTSPIKRKTHKKAKSSVPASK